MDSQIAQNPGRGVRIYDSLLAEHNRMRGVNFKDFIPDPLVNSVECRREPVSEILLIGKRASFPRESAAH